MKQTYNSKFKNFIKARKQKQTNTILIAHLWVIWDTIEEINQSIQLAISNNKKIRVVTENDNFSYTIG